MSNNEDVNQCRSLRILMKVTAIAELIYSNSTQAESLEETIFSNY